MTLKRFFAIMGIVICGWAFYSGVLIMRYEKNAWSGSSLILKFEKNSAGSLAVQRYYQKASEAVRELSDASLGGKTMTQHYQEQPVLFGILFIFFGVATCIASFAVHIFRTDSRFN